MRPGRLVLWLRRIAYSVVAAGCVAEIAILVQGLRSDHVPVNRATYVGSLVAIAGILAGVLQRVAGSPPTPTVLERLRSVVGDAIRRRARQLRLTSQEIDLELASNRDGRNVSMQRFVEDLSQRARFGVVVAGARGTGKSYTALQLAERLLQRPDVLPVVIPLSRWPRHAADDERILVDFIHDEFNVTKRSAESLIRQGAVVPIFDGFDEMAADADQPSVLTEFLNRLHEWRRFLGPSRFLVAVRDDAWDRVPLQVRRRAGLDVFRIQPITRAHAEQFLSLSLPTVDHQFPGALIAALESEGLDAEVTRASRLAMVGRVLEQQVDFAGMAVNVADFAADVRRQGLHEMFLVAVVSANRRAWHRLMNSLAVAELSVYARYLAANALLETSVAGRRLETRDILVHRLWPVGGYIRPRVMDACVALVVSTPGLVWLGTYMTARGALGVATYAAFVLAWMAMLIRTGTKAWVRPAVPDWSRLRRPTFVVRQTAAALLVGGATFIFAPSWLAPVTFLIAWLLIGLSVGFGQTLTTDTQVRVVGPTGVLDREHLISRVAALVAFPVIAVAFVNSLGWGYGLLVTAVYCALVGETVASALWRRYLALCLSRPLAGITPSRALARAYDLGLLRSAGLSYQFREDELVEFFAGSAFGKLWVWRVTKGSPRRTAPRIP